MFQYSRKFLWRACVVAVIPSLSTVCALAQTAVSGAIIGSISDPSGARVPNATVTVISDATNATSDTKADSAGNFRFPNLSPGTYTVTVSAPGFEQAQNQHVTVEVGQPTTLDERLTLGANSQTVQVDVADPLINEQSNDFSNIENQVQINNLPINGRRWSNFALLTPGANPDGGFGLIAFRGISGLLNNNTIDGGDDNQAFFSEARGRTRLSYSFTQAAVEEFQVNTSNYSAQYGRSAGAVINTVSKSGTNQFHGSGFWYWRDNEFGATNPFFLRSTLNPATNTVTSVHIKPKDKRHQWGGTLGGPIFKDKLFFFYAYDQQHRNFPGVAATSSPKYLNLSSTDKATLAARGVNAAQITAAQQYVLGLTGVVPRVGDQIINFPKLDWHISDRHTASIEYNRARWNSPAGIQTSPVVSRGIASFGNDFVKVDSIVARLESAFTPSVSNQLRYQYGRDFEYETSQTPASGEPLTGPNHFPPSVSLGGGGLTYGKPNFLNRRAYPDERRNQATDTITQVIGHHTLTYGADYNNVEDRSDNLFAEEGVYSYSNLANWITDFSYPNSPKCDAARDAKPGTLPCYSSYTQGFGRSSFTFNTNEIAGFLQDDWKVLPTLTLNFGMRYEYQNQPNPQIPNANFPPTRKFPSDRTDIGPRFGFAFDPTGNGKTVIRGGYGIYYGRLENSTIYNAIINTGNPNGQLQLFLNNASAGAPLFPQTLTAAAAKPAAIPNIVYFQPDFKLPQVQEADLAVQHDIGWNTVFSVNYLLSLGRRLPTYVDTNIAPATQTVTYTIKNGSVAGLTPRLARLDGKQFTLPLYTKRINPAFGQLTQITSEVNSNYHALVVEAQHRLQHGLQFDLNYTFSKAIDDGQTSQTFTSSNTPTDPYNLAFDRGLSNFDIRSRFVGTVVWQPHATIGNAVLSTLANGWELAPVVVLTSGAPYSAVISGGVNGVPGQNSINGSGGNTGVDQFLPLLGRNTFKQPRISNVDLRASRSLMVKEKYKVEALAEAFNLFNRFQVTGVQNTAYSLSGTTLAPQATGSGGSSFSTFGTATSAGNGIYRERQLQLALRLEF